MEQWNNSCCITESHQVMESLEHAMKRDAPIIADYVGGGVTFDAHHITSPRDDGLGMSLCIEKCLKDAGVSPEEVFFFYIAFVLC